MINNFYYTVILLFTVSITTYSQKRDNIYGYKWNELYSTRCICNEVNNKYAINYITSNLRLPYEVDTSVSPTEGEKRNYFFYTGIGFMEVIVIGFGHQINDNWSVAVKLNGILLSGGFIGPNGGTGVGFKVSYFLPKGSLFFDVINAEPTYLFDVGGVKDSKGFSFQLTIGDEEVYDKGINFLWSLGGVVSSGTGSPPLYFPSAKVGFNLF